MVVMVMAVLICIILTTSLTWSAENKVDGGAPAMGIMENRVVLWLWSRPCFAGGVPLGARSGRLRRGLLVAAPRAHCGGT